MEHSCIPLFFSYVAITNKWSWWYAVCVPACTPKTAAKGCTFWWHWSGHNGRLFQLRVKCVEVAQGGPWTRFKPWASHFKTVVIDGTFGIERDSCPATSASVLKAEHLQLTAWMERALCIVVQKNNDLIKCMLYRLSPLTVGRDLWHRETPVHLPLPQFWMQNTTNCLNGKGIVHGCTGKQSLDKMHLVQVEPLEGRSCLCKFFTISNKTSVLLDVLFSVFRSVAWAVVTLAGQVLDLFSTSLSACHFKVFPSNKWWNYEVPNRHEIRWKRQRVVLNVVIKCWYSTILHEHTWA